MEIYKSILTIFENYTALEIICITIIVFGFFLLKNLIKYYGKQVAEILTKEELTIIEQNVIKDFNTKHEELKNNLSLELSTQIEPLKADLAKQNISHQIKLNYLHQERSKAIIKIYYNFKEMHSAILDWTTPFRRIISDPEQEEKDRLKRVEESIASFRDYFIANRPFLSLSLCNQIDSVYEKYWDLYRDFHFEKAIHESEQSKKYLTQLHLNKLKKIRNEISYLETDLDKIENVFRSLLSVD